MDILRLINVAVLHGIPKANNATTDYSGTLYTTENVRRA